MTLFREEVKRLKLIKDNKNIFKTSELKEIVFDSFVILKDKIYNVVLKIFDILDSKKVKS